MAGPPFPLSPYLYLQSRLRLQAHLHNAVLSINAFISDRANNRGSWGSGKAGSSELELGLEGGNGIAAEWSGGLGADAVVWMVVDLIGEVVVW